MFPTRGCASKPGWFLVAWVPGDSSCVESCPSVPLPVFHPRNGATNTGSHRDHHLTDTDTDTPRRDDGVLGCWDLGAVFGPGPMPRSVS